MLRAQKVKIVMMRKLHQPREGKFIPIRVSPSKEGSNFSDSSGIKRQKIAQLNICRPGGSAKVNSNKLETPIGSPLCPLSPESVQYLSSDLDCAPVMILWKLITSRYLRFSQKPLIFENFY